MMTLHIKLIIKKKTEKNKAEKTNSFIIYLKVRKISHMCLLNHFCFSLLQVFFRLFSPSKKQSKTIRSTILPELPITHMKFISQTLENNKFLWFCPLSQLWIFVLFSYQLISILNPSKPHEISSISYLFDETLSFFS